jgi:hypothetical protein
MNENTMEYPANDEEFYAICSLNLERVYSAPVSFEEQRKLQYMIYETMGCYEEGKKIKIEDKKNFEKIGEGLAYLENSLYQMRANIGKIDESGKIALINAQIASAQMKEAVKKINQTKKQVIETTKGLQRKLEAKDAILKITLGMVNQKPKN